MPKSMVSQHHSSKHTPLIAPFTQCGTTSNPTSSTYKNSTSPANSRRHASTNLGSPQKSNAYPAANNELTTYVETNQPPPENTGNTGNYKNRQNNTANLPMTHIYINNLISPDNSTNPKRLYTYIKHQRNDQSGIQQLQDNDGFITPYSLTKANILNHHFQSVFTQNEDTSTIPDKGASLWAAVFTFYPYLLISINELLISIIHLLISINELLISIIHLLISINMAASVIFIDINNSFIDINK